jgi:hypothetical protein
LNEYAAKGSSKLHNHFQFPECVAV